MSIVWIANLSEEFDYENAKSFGELRSFTSGYQNLGNLERLNIMLCKEVYKTDKDDYLLLGGVILVNVLAALAWLGRHRKVKLLLWDNRIRTYRVLHIKLDDFDRLFEMLTINESKANA